jgi:hypothetical protein
MHLKRNGDATWVDIIAWKNGQQHREEWRNSNAAVKLSVFVR